MPREPTRFEGRGEGAHLVTLGAHVDSTPAGQDGLIRVDVEELLPAKLAALAAYRSQFPIVPDMLPRSILVDVFGAEYFVPAHPASRGEPRARFKTGAI